MRRFLFNKPLVETELPPRTTDAYFVYVDERTKTLANIMDFVKGNWQVKFFVDDIDIWNRSSTRLDIPNKIKLNPNGIIAAWLKGSDYESKVKEAAYDFSYVIGELKSLVNTLNTAIPLLSGVIDDVETAGATEAASTISTVVNTLSDEAFSGLIEGDAIEHLEALSEAIDNTSEE